MRYLDEDLYIDIDFARDEAFMAYEQESGTFEIQTATVWQNSWVTIFKGTFNKSDIWRENPLRFHINDFVRVPNVIDLTEYYNESWQEASVLYKYRIVATSEYEDTQTGYPIEVYPAYRNPETLSQMPSDWESHPMSLIRQPMVPHYPAMISGYDPCILIYRKNTAPALTTEEGLYFADSKGLIQNVVSLPFSNLIGRSYFKGDWQSYSTDDDGVRKVLKKDGSGFDTIQTTAGIDNPKYVFVKFTNNRYVLEEAFILDECPRDFYLHWIDRYGGVQCQPLRQNYKQTQNYTRDSAQNLINETHDYLNSVQTSYTFNTDWINRQELAVWESIMVSPMVCLIDTRARMSRRVLVTDKSFSQKTFDNTHALFNMTFNVKLTKTQPIYL